MTRWLLIILLTLAIAHNHVKIAFTWSAFQELVEQNANLFEDEQKFEYVELIQISHLTMLQEGDIEGLKERLVYAVERKHYELLEQEESLSETERETLTHVSKLLSSIKLSDNIQ
jgi:hypothetical protein